LQRYTGERFELAADWKSWFAQHGEHLFFSEMAGYKWLSSLRSESEPIRVRTLKRTDNPDLIATESEPLVWSTDLESLGGSEYRLNIDIQIAEGWHAYHRVPRGQPYQAFQVEAEWPDGWETDEKWSRPKYHPDPNTPGMFVFDGFQSVSLKLTAPDGFDTEESAGGEIDSLDLDGFLVTVSYQVCDERMCLPPAEVEREVEIFHSTPPVTIR